MNELISLNEISQETQKEILRKNWQSHDGRWQYSMFSLLGPKIGNEQNKTIAKAVYNGGMHRLLNAFELTRISDISTFQKVMQAALDLFHAHSDFDIKIDITSPSSVVGIVRKCGAYDSVRKAKVEDIYDCGCFSCREGFYEAMGLNVNEKCNLCLAKGDVYCDVQITVEDWI